MTAVFILLAAILRIHFRLVFPGPLGGSGGGSGCVGVLLLLLLYGAGITFL